MRISRRFAEDRERKRNFDAGTVESAVAAANLVSMIDPDKVGSDEVEVIAKATGTEPDFIENLVDLVDQANNSSEPVEEVQETFSRSVRKLISNMNESNKKRKKYFADEPASMVATADIIGMLDDEALDTLPTDEIAEVVSDATGTPEEVVEAIVEIAKNNFHLGRKYEAKKSRNFNREKYVKLEFDNKVVDETSMDEKVGAEDPKVVKGAVDKPEVPPTNELPPAAVAQDPEEEKKMDPKPGDSAADASEAGKTMVVQNDLATVEGLASVKPFSRSKQDFSNSLKSLLGDLYIPNEE